MTTKIYCNDCDREINRRYKKNHIKSKQHLYMRHNMIINKHNLGDLHFGKIESLIKEYINDNRNKFEIFNILVKFEIGGNYESCLISNRIISIPLYKFENLKPICYKYCQSRKVVDYIKYKASIKDIVLKHDTIIKNVSITLLSHYRMMTPKHKLQQNRRILTSKLITKIKKLSYGEKMSKYYFLCAEYDLF